MYTHACALMTRRLECAAVSPWICFPLLCCVASLRLELSPPPPTVRARALPCPVLPPFVRAPTARLSRRRQNVHTRLKSMGNLLSRDSEEPTIGAGLNLKRLKEMLLPPPHESQRERSSASTIRK